MSNLAKENIHSQDTGASEKDAALIGAFLKGDKSAFDRLVLLYQDRVFNLCYRMMGDYTEANDMAQETFVKVFKSVGGFHFKSRFSTWLYRIAVNTCNNRLKSLDYRFRKMKRPFGFGEDENTKTANPWVSSDTSTPLDALEKKEQALLIQNAVNKLANGKKTVLVLRDMEGLSYEEIAGITGLNIGTVKSKLARARTELKKKLSGVI